MDISEKRREACKQLGINDTGRLLYGAQAAADAMGVSVGTVRKYVEPADYAKNPYYRHAGAPVGLYDPIDLVAALATEPVAQAKARYAARKAAAEKATSTRMVNMEDRMEKVEITIEAGWSEERICKLARATHGGNYRGDPGPFYWSNQTARNCIRHCLTNYENLWAFCNRGYTGERAYRILRDRVDALIAETYPEYQDPDPTEGAESC
ncbi:MAG: hypothetical protein KF718_02495 [Polyangiaceae bacterium]|nr:hypothetical protein [Polyangiaceae bacterium]